MNGILNMDMKHFDRSEVPYFCDSNNWIYRITFDNCSCCGSKAKMYSLETRDCNHIFYVECNDNDCHRIYLDSVNVTLMRQSVNKESEMAYRHEMVKKWNEFNESCRQRYNNNN